MEERCEASLHKRLGFSVSDMVSFEPVYESSPSGVRSCMTAVGIHLSELPR